MASSGLFEIKPIGSILEWDEEWESALWCIVAWVVVVVFEEDRTVASIAGYSIPLYFSNDDRTNNETWKFIK